MSIQQTINNLKSKGYKVYAPVPLTTYVYFTDAEGERIGYAQYSSMRGEEFSTRHKPHRNIGTGFQADSAEEALSFAPSWVHGADRGFVVKYKDFETFRKGYWQQLVEV